ncbi:unnamed protein product [Vitrella brassicaformis CCMP3155]|uniref:Uncharacterized protein n=1 Tax=Vitrella brassicaformis (strain CCMP3155) TaxID=1169540 RepID=A0A0G4ELP7_VITBC|nr:unnamed protein product [Vitrella brassicaformis CCMP3155]|eukprot:CEL97944.1 unnamed protein product [Vitrella brassicaformis CCMP3155]
MSDQEHGEQDPSPVGQDGGDSPEAQQQQPTAENGHITTTEHQEAGAVDGDQQGEGNDGNQEQLNTESKPHEQPADATVDESPAVQPEDSNQPAEETDGDGGRQADQQQQQQQQEFQTPSDHSNDALERTTPPQPPSRPPKCTVEAMVKQHEQLIESASPPASPVVTKPEQGAQTVDQHHIDKGHTADDDHGQAAKDDAKGREGEGEEGAVACGEGGEQVSPPDVAVGLGVDGSCEGEGVGVGVCGEEGTAEVAGSVDKEAKDKNNTDNNKKTAPAAAGASVAEDPEKSAGAPAVTMVSTTKDTDIHTAKEEPLKDVQMPKIAPFVPSQSQELIVAPVSVSAGRNGDDDSDDDLGSGNSLPAANQQPRQQQQPSEQPAPANDDDYDWGSAPANNDDDGELTYQQDLIPAGESYPIGFSTSRQLRRATSAPQLQETATTTVADGIDPRRATIPQVDMLFHTLFGPLLHPAETREAMLLVAEAFQGMTSVTTDPRSLQYWARQLNNAFSSLTDLPRAMPHICFLLVTRGASMPNIAVWRMVIDRLTLDHARYRLYDDTTFETMDLPGAVRRMAISLLDLVLTELLDGDQRGIAYTLSNIADLTGLLTYARGLPIRPHELDLHAVTHTAVQRDRLADILPTLVRLFAHTRHVEPDPDLDALLHDLYIHHTRMATYLASIQQRQRGYVAADDEFFPTPESMRREIAEGPQLEPEKLEALVREVEEEQKRRQEEARQRMEEEANARQASASASAAAAAAASSSSVPSLMRDDVRPSEAPGPPSRSSGRVPLGRSLRPLQPWTDGNDAVDERLCMPLQTSQTRGGGETAALAEPSAGSDVAIAPTTAQQGDGRAPSDDQALIAAHTDRDHRSSVVDPSHEHLIAGGSAASGGMAGGGGGNLASLQAQLNTLILVAGLQMQEILTVAHQVRALDPEGVYTRTVAGPMTPSAANMLQTIQSFQASPPAYSSVPSLLVPSARTHRAMSGAPVSRAAGAPRSHAGGRVDAVATVDHSGRVVHSSRQILTSSEAAGGTGRAREFVGRPSRTDLWLDFDRWTTDQTMTAAPQVAIGDPQGAFHREMVLPTRTLRNIQSVQHQLPSCGLPSPPCPTCARRSPYTDPLLARSADYIPSLALALQRSPCTRPVYHPSRRWAPLRVVRPLRLRDVAAGWVVVVGMAVVDKEEDSRGEGEWEGHQWEGAREAR